jgi:acyl dehydratase
MLDRTTIGMRSTPFNADVEKGRLRLFAKAIGETNPVYFDETAARAAGHRSLLMPPTFLFCLEMEQADPYRWFRDLNIPLPYALHGEQAFHYHRAGYAGDVMTFVAEIIDIYAKKDGALEFAVQDVFITNQHDEAVADFRRTIVVRNP